jgi:predicted MFS family arabinose efflux permease
MGSGFESEPAAGPEPASQSRRGPRPGSWRVLAAYVFLVAMSHVLWISFASVTSAAARTFHTTEVAIGLLVSVGPICSALLSIPAGVLPDRIGYRTPLLWAGLATAGFALARPMAGSFPLLLILTVALLIPQPFLINAVADVVNRHFPDDEAATATGLGTMAIFLGITIGVAATPAVVDLAGIRGTQFIYAALSAVALIVFWAVAPNPVPERLAAPMELSVRLALRRVLRSRTMWILSAVIFLGFGFYLGMPSWLAEILKPRHIGESGAGLVAGTITIAGVAGTVALGALSDRIRRRKPFVVLAGVVAVPCLWLLGHLGAMAALVPVAVLMGFFLLAALPVSIAVISEDSSLGPQVASTGVGVMLTAGNLGGAMVVAAMGILKSIQGNFSGAVLLTCVLAAVAVVFALALPEPLAPAARKVT